MVTNISNSYMSSGMTMMQRNNQQSITQEQRQLIQDTLSQYDPKNLTQEQATSIVEAFKEAGIGPGQALEEVMDESGFDARSVGDLAGVGDPQQSGSRMPPPPPPDENPTTLNISDTSLQQLKDLLDEYYSINLSEDEKEGKLSAIKELFQGTVPEGSLVNVYA